MSSSIMVRIPQDLRSQLEAICRKEKLPVSNLVRQSLRRYIAIRCFRELRKQVLPFAEAQGLLTDEDIFHKLQQN